MSDKPKSPVALFLDDGTVEVHGSINTIVRDVEAPEYPGVFVVDSAGELFSLTEEESRGGWFERALSGIIGGPKRCVVVPSEGVVSPEQLAQAQEALTGSFPKR